MKLKLIVLTTFLATLIFFNGCSKDIDEYNKPAIYWYSKIVSSVADGDIEKADNYYASLQGEHIGSPLLPEATLILAYAHQHYQEYILSEHFSDEYIKRYANANEKEYSEFMKIKAKYMALPNPRRDQVLMQEAITDGEIFKKNYPRSMYYDIVNTMLTKLYMAEAALNETIAQLYIRLDKPRSAEFYRNIKPQPWIKWDEIDRANTFWFREWFEGDGTESWYAFMIPDTQSVVSRNTNKVDDDTTVDDQSTENLPTQETKDLSQNGEAMKDPSKTQAKEPKPMTLDKEEELEQAKFLRDKGILSEEEFKMLKRQIINR
jgi:outer membrane protein assembly factor BamD